MFTTPPITLAQITKHYLPYYEHHYIMVSTTSLSEAQGTNQPRLYTLQQQDKSHTLH